MTGQPLKIFTGNANPELAKAICDYLDLPLGASLLQRFPDGELNVKVNEDIRGKDVFVVQPTCPPVNEHLMELLTLIDCVKRASADRVTAVVPYYGYARKDRKDEGRVPITAKLVANLITKAGADRILAMDLHAGQIQGFFDIPVDHLTALPVLTNYCETLMTPNSVVVAPDVGSVKIAVAFADVLGGEVAVIYKQRIDAQTVRPRYVIGNVEGKEIIMVDDMIAGATSVVEASRLLKEQGAGTIQVAATHPVFCGEAFEKLKNSPIDAVAVTDTIPLADDAPRDRLRVLTVAPLLGEAIKRIHTHESVSALFRPRRNRRNHD